MKHDTNMIARASDVIRQHLGDDFDEETFWDTLDGETDALRIVDHLIAQAHDSAAMSDAAKAQADELKARSDRFKRRATAAKAALLQILQTTGERKLERPGATVSIQKGRESVKIFDAAAVPSQLHKVVSTPDLTAIKAQIAAGENVPGCTIERGPETLRMGVK